MVEGAQSSAGASDKQFEKTMESLTAKLNTLKNAYHEFLMGILDSNIIKGGVDALTGLFNILNNLADLTGPLSGLVKVLMTVGMFMGGRALIHNGISAISGGLAAAVSAGSAAAMGAGATKAAAAANTAKTAMAANAAGKSGIGAMMAAMIGGQAIGDIAEKARAGAVKKATSAKDILGALALGVAPDVMSEAGDKLRGYANDTDDQHRKDFYEKGAKYYDNKEAEERKSRVKAIDKTRQPFAKRAGALAIAGADGLANTVSLLGAIPPQLLGIAAGVAAVGAAVAISEHIHQKRIDNMNELIEQHQEAKQVYNDNKAALESLEEEYNTLSKGVDKNGKNIGLSAEQYERYKEVAQEIADISPEVVDSIDIEGNVILKDDAIKKAQEALDFDMELQNASFSSETGLKTLIRGVQASTSDIRNEYSDSAKEFNKLVQDNAFSGTKAPKGPVTKGRYSTGETEIYGEEVLADYDKQSDFRPKGPAIKGYVSPNSYSATTEDLEDLYDERYQILSDAKEDLNNIAEEFGTDSKEYQEAVDDYYNLQGLIDQGGQLKEELKAAREPIIESLKTFATSDRDFSTEGVQSLADEVAKDNEQFFSKFIEDTALDDTLSATQMQDYVQYASEMLSGDNEFGKKVANEFDIMEEAKDKFDESARDTEAIEEYNNSISDSIDNMESYIQELREEGTDEALALADSLEAQLINLESYAQEGKMTISEAFNDLQGEINEANKAYEKYQSETSSGDYYTGRQSFNQIYEDITSDINFAGEGSQSFWAGAQALLSEDFIDSAETAEEVQNAVKNLGPLMEDGAAGANAFARKIKSLDKQTLESLGIGIGENGKLDFSNFDYSNIEGLANSLGISKDFAVALLNNARQFGDLEFSNIEALAHTLKDQGTGLFYKDENGNEKAIISYEFLEANSGMNPIQFKEWLAGQDYFVTIKYEAGKGKEVIDQIAGIVGENSIYTKNTNNEVVGVNYKNVLSALYTSGMEQDEVVDILTDIENDGIQLAGKDENLTIEDAVEQDFAKLADIEQPLVQASDSMNSASDAMWAVAAALGVGTSPGIQEQTKGNITASEQYTFQGESPTTDELEGYNLGTSYDTYQKTRESQYTHEAAAKAAEDAGNDATAKKEWDLANQAKVAADAQSKDYYTAKDFRQGFTVYSEQGNVIRNPLTGQALSTDSSKSPLGNYLNNQYSSMGKEEYGRRYAEINNLSSQSAFSTSLSGSQFKKIFESDDIESEFNKAIQKIQNEQIKIDAKVDEDGSFEKFKIETDKLKNQEIITKIKTSIVDGHGKPTGNFSQFLKKAGFEDEEIQKTVDLLVKEDGSINLEGLEDFINDLPPEHQLDFLINFADYTPEQLQELVNSSESNEATVTFSTNAATVTPLLSDINAEISNANSKTVTVTFVSDTSQWNPPKTDGYNQMGSNRPAINYGSVAKGHLFGSAAKGTNSPKGMGVVGPHGHGGMTLTGELGPELVWEPDRNVSYMVGVGGPEVVPLPGNAVVYPANMTKNIVNGNRSHPQFGSMYQGGFGENSGSGSGSGSGNGSGKVKRSPDKSTGGSRSKAGTEEEKWENDIDWLYNLLEDINEVIRDREKLEHRYDRLLEQRNASLSDLIKLQDAQLENLRIQKALEEERLEKRMQEMREYIAENSKLSSDYGIKFNEEDMTIEINWDAINAITDEEEGEKVNDMISRLEEIQDDIDKAEDSLMEIEELVAEIEARGKEEFLDLEDRIIDALESIDQQEIDRISEISDSISDGQSKLLDSIQKSIDKQRQERDNQKAEEDLGDMRRRLAYLRQDTSGMNALEIKQLEEQLKEEEEAYGDTLVDQKLQEIQDQNDEASEQRERQIAIMEEQLEWNRKSGYYADQARQILVEARNDLNDGKDLLLTTLYQIIAQGENWQNKSDEDLIDSKGELNQQLKESSLYLDNRNNENYMEDMQEWTKVILDPKSTNEDKAEAVFQISQLETQRNLKLNEEEKAKIYGTSTDTAYTDLARDLAEGTSVNYMTNMQKALASGDLETLQINEDLRNKKLQLMGKSNEQTNFYEQALKAQKDTVSFAASGEQGYVDYMANLNNALKTGDFDQAYYWELMRDRKIIEGNLNAKTTGGSITLEAMKNWNTQQQVVQQQQSTVSQPKKVSELWNGTFTITRQTTGDIVEAITYALNKMGLYSGAASKSFTDESYKALRKFAGISQNLNPFYFGPKTMNRFKEKGYLRGGLADYTGLAWLDGTPSKPELVLNARDTENFIQLKDVLADLRGFKGKSEQSEKYGDTYYDVQINVDKIANDYDVEQLANKIKKIIHKDSMYRNVNAINFLR